MPFLEAEAALRTALSNCAAFQTLGGFANAAAALAKIFQVEAAATDTRVFAIVEAIEGRRQRLETGAADQFAGTMLVGLRIQASTSVTLATFRAAVQDIWKQLEAQAAAATRYADVIAIECTLMPSRPERPEAIGNAQGDFFDCELEVELGSVTTS